MPESVQGRQSASKTDGIYENRGASRFVFINTTGEPSSLVENEARRKTVRKHARLQGEPPTTLVKEPPDPASKLAFVTVMGKPSQASDDESIRNRVRVHAARHINKSSSVPVKLTEPMDCPTHTTISHETHGMYRFALNSRKPMRRGPRRPKKSASPIADVITERPGIVSSLAERVLENKDEHTECIDRSPSRDFADLHFTYAERLDSVNALPSHSAPLVELFVRYTLALFIDTERVLHINPTQDWISFAAKDTALLHSSLSIASLYHDTGRSDLYHSNEAMRIVARRLGNTSEEISNATLGAVALLVIHDSLTHTFGNTAIHFAGLEQLVNARGGLKSIPARLAKVFIQLDVSYSSIYNCRPRFPLMYPSKQASVAMSYHATRMMPDYPVDAIERIYASRCNSDDIIQVIYTLPSLFEWIPPQTTAERISIMDIIYVVNYQISVGFQGLPNFPQGRMPEPLRIAAMLYIYLFVWHGSHTNTTGLVRRLADAIISSEHLTLEHDIRTSLWILVIGAHASWGQTERPHFVEWLSEICSARSKSDFESEIDGVIPEDRVSELHRLELWKEMSSLRSNNG